MWEAEDHSVQTEHSSGPGRNLCRSASQQPTVEARMEKESEKRKKKKSKLVTIYGCGC